MTGTGTAFGSGFGAATDVGHGTGSGAGVGPIAGQQLDLGALDIGGPPPDASSPYFAEDIDDLPPDCLDWDDDYPDDDSDDEPRRDPERPIGRSVRPVIVFESVTGRVEYEIPRYQRVLGSRGVMESHRRRLGVLAEFLAVNHGEALAAPTLSRVFAALPATTQKQVAGAMDLGGKDATTFSRWYPELFVSAPAGILPLPFLFCRRSQSHRKGDFGPVLAASIRQARRQEIALTATDPVNTSTILDLALPKLATVRLAGQTDRQLRDVLRKDLPVVSALVTHPAEVTAFRRLWPQADPYGLLAAVGIDKKARTTGVTYAWAALCGALDEGESRP